MSPHRLVGVGCRIEAMGWKPYAPPVISWTAAEKGILASHGVGDHARCTTLAVKFAGPAIKSYLRKSIANPALLEDAYSEWTELVATSWDQYDPTHAVAAWLYVLARRPRGRAINATNRSARLESEVPETLPASVPREATSPHVRTTVKEEFRSLWEKLAPLDRELLRLRIEEGLSWEEVARILRGPSWRPSSDELKREMQNLAARYKRRVKDALTVAANDRGLVERYGVEL